ncbi:MAG: DUF389 domain-containing protein [Ramlibacter sp.]|nr:DUF389 domain-containing protein [Cryobacterium sp.]
MNDLPVLRDSVFFEGEHRRERISRFWILLVLSSVIAAAGVASDSTATVIGAMIIAPLMVPIMGTMLATVLGDPKNLSRSIGVMVAGAAVAVAIALVIGLLLPVDVVAQNNSQVAARVNPRLIDLLAALGTGVVGSIALVRRDISDTLPGVAIAISLVPPLSVVGFTLEASVQVVTEAWARAAGWDLASVTTAQDTVVVRVEGALPVPDTDRLKELLGAAGIDPALVRVVLIPAYTVDF